MPQRIIDFYIYFLYYGTKKSREAFDRFYDADDSRSWVRQYAVLGNRFYSEFMSRYSKEIREMNQKSSNGITTSRGELKCQKLYTA